MPSPSEHVSRDIQARRVAAIVRTDNANTAEKAASAAIAGGFRMVEFTLTTPGAFTPTEMVRAHRLGAPLVKLFPAPADMAGYIRFLLGPLPYLKIFPTAGVTPENMVDILRAGAAGLGFVGSLFSPEDLASGNFPAIEKRAAAIMERLQLSG